MWRGKTENYFSLIFTIVNAISVVFYSDFNENYSLHQFSKTSRYERSRKMEFKSPSWMLLLEMELFSMIILR